MANNAKAILRLEFASNRQLSTILNALTPEAKIQVTRRAYIKLEKKGLILIMTIEAEDTIALRATLNAYLGWLYSIIKVMKILGQDLIYI
jgi:tRNA threonylcarbamoyladenosine modification (KEOPS) complex  Pcc1 subunit